MNLLQLLVKKLGAYTQAKQGTELIFACPRCGRMKFYVNPKKRLFQCFRCSYAGYVDQILDSLEERVPHIERIWNQIQSSAEMAIIPPFPMEVIPKFRKSEMPYTFKYFLESRGFDFYGDQVKEWGFSDDFKLKDRIIIPIKEDGKVVSYVARSWDGTEPKEISGPNRSQYLYGLDDISPDQRVVLVEGIFDCEHLRKHGYNAVAVMGSHLSDIQIGKLLAKKPSSIVIMFDGDEAGMNGTKIAYAKLIKRTHTPIDISWLPEGKDPDDLSKEELELQFETGVNPSS